MFTAISGVGLVPRLNVVGVPSEARLLYVVDNDISEGGAGTESHVRRKRGEDVMIVIVVSSPCLQVCWITSDPGQSTGQALPATPVVQVIPSPGQTQPGSLITMASPQTLHHQDQGNSTIT